MDVTANRKNRLNRQFWDKSVVIFTGGGAPVIRPFLEQRLDHGNLLRVDDRHAHLANAIGAWRFAAFRRANA